MCAGPDAAGVLARAGEVAAPAGREFEQPALRGEPSRGFGGLGGGRRERPAFVETRGEPRGIGRPIVQVPLDGSADDLAAGRRDRTLLACAW
ncbi:MAG: hypothetical protein DWB43_06130 [Lautropia sp.]|nr:hypothetical protein [Lautropia sp.]RIK90211.1 MAG: hypothetical protein DCC70_05245 [Burkholderiales bacterium]